MVKRGYDLMIEVITVFFVSKGIIDEGQKVEGKHEEKADNFCVGNNSYNARLF